MRKYFYTLYRVFILIEILFFTYTLYYKVFWLEAFQMNIARSGFWAPELIPSLSIAVIIVESIAILFLTFSPRWGLRFSLVMMSSFTGYIILLYLYRKYEVCGCGGILNNLPFYQHLMINGVLILLNALTLKSYSRNANDN